MFKQAAHITEGFSKLALIALGFTNSPEYAIKRYEICLKCDRFNPEKKTCGKCGCYCPAKSQVKNEECPHETGNKWEYLL